MSSVTSSDVSAHLGVTLLRVSLGVMWIAHALLKLLVFTLPGSAAALRRGTFLVPQATRA